MPPKASAGRRRVAAGKKQDAIEIVVRRGAIRRFDALKTRTSELPVVVTWDRRTDDRRDDGRRDEEDATAAKRNRRQTDRRRKPPFTWDLADFVVVEPAKPRKASRKKTTRK
jgi:hypothetical protein